MNKKTLYLLLALALPGLVFLFLKFFGKNHFDIPVYYKNGVEKQSSECRIIGKGQYFLPDSILNTVGWNDENVLLISGANAIEKKELDRLIHDSEGHNIQIISLDEMNKDRMHQWKTCYLFLSEPWKAVLIDNQKRIRGYYALNNREEIDRLDVELEILLKK